MSGSHTLLGRYLWWLVSRASGVVALVLISASVLIGLTLAARLISRPTLRRSLAGLHEHIALAGLALIAIHGVALLGDSWLKPGLRGIAVPFAMGYRPAFTGLGIIAGYLAAILGLSFYARRRIGPRLWRRLHRATVAVWVLAAVHAVGAGSDAGAIWLRAIVLGGGAGVLVLFVLRGLRGRAAVTRPAVPARGAAPVIRDAA